jgi:hypothetical protein
MSAILLRPPDLRSRRSWKASTSSSLIRRCRLPGKELGRDVAAFKEPGREGTRQPQQLGRLGRRERDLGGDGHDRPARRQVVRGADHQSQQRRRQADLRTVGGAEHQLSAPRSSRAQAVKRLKIDGNRIDPRGLSKNTFARHPTGRLVRSRVEAVQYELLK